MNMGKTKKNTSLKRWFNTTTKVLTWLVIIHGFLDVDAIIVLGYVNGVGVLESLGITIVSEIIAPLLLLFAKTTIENIFEKNNIFPKKDSDII